MNDKLLKEVKEIEDQWDILTLKVALEQYQRLALMHLECQIVCEDCEELDSST